MSCNTEEVDDCLFLHALDISKIFDQILIKAVDSDIVIVTTAAFPKKIFIKGLWIEFGKGNSLTTLFISNKWKIVFWDKWKLMPEITSIFAKQRNVRLPAETTEENYELIERLFIVL